MKERKNQYHIFRNAGKVKMQKYFILYDTETRKTTDENGTTTNTLKMGWAMFWIREKNKKDKKEWFFFTDYKKFWKWVISKFNKEIKSLILFCHNADFDTKIVNALPYLTKTGFTFENGCFKKGSFFMHFKKKGEYIKLWDTASYCKRKLEDIGKDLGYAKGKIDFDTCSFQELKVYNKQDVEILYQFMKKFCNFFEKNELTALKPTIAGISRNSFRGTKFYDRKNNPIWIHDKWDAIELERHSYRGGITDCFKIGEYKQKLYYTDITSSYPNELRNKKIPIKLIYHTNNLITPQKEINEIFRNHIHNENFGIIANVDVYIPHEHAYILIKGKVGNEDKSLFLGGKFNTSLTTPEIEYVLKYGKILKIKEISIYEMNNVYKNFIDFFHKIKKQSVKNQDATTKQITKDILNSSYGFWGTKNHSLKHVGISNENKVVKYNEKILKINDMVITSTKIQIGNQIFLQQTNNEGNSFDSMVAIASFVTAYARMNLIRFILRCGRGNVFYVDTDSLIVNKKGFKRLKKANYVHPFTLGLLKVEHILTRINIIKPKFYEYDYIEENKFKNKKICKGKKANAKIICENKNVLVVENELWETTNSILRTGNFGKQIIFKQQKVFTKIYDKGIIIRRCIFPFYINGLDNG